MKYVTDIEQIKKILQKWKSQLANKLSQLKEKVRELHIRFLGYRFRVKQQLRQLFSSPQFKHKLFSLIGIWTVLFFTLWGLFNEYLRYYLTSSDALAYFVGVAAMIAGMVALVFSFSQFLLSNASEKLPANFYEMSARDGFHNVVLFVTAVFVIFFLLCSVLFGKFGWGLSDESITFSVYLVGVIFILLYMLYEKTIERTNPKKVLVQIIRKNILKSVDRVAKDAKEITSMLSKLPSAQRADAAATAVTAATSFNSPFIQQELGDIQKNLNYLFDYHGLLVERNELASANEVLDLIIELIIKYLEERKHSSLIIPTGMMLVGQSDSHSFLASSLERLLSIAENYMEKNDKAGIAKIVNLMVVLCQKATDVEFVENRLGDNPIFEQFRGYLDLMTNSAIRLKNEEAMFQIIIAYPKISELAVKHRYRHEFGHIYGSLDKLFMASLGKGVELQDVLIGQVIESYTTILKQLVLGEYWLLEHELDDVFDHIVDTLHYTMLLMKIKNGGLRSAYFVQTSLTGPFEMARGLIFTLFEKARTIKKKENKRKVQGQLLLLTEETRRALRSLSEKLKDPNSLLVLSLAGVIQDITILLIDLLDDEEWSEHSMELERKIGWYLHQPEWFMADVESFETDQSFDGLVNAIAQIGMKAIDKEKFDIAKEALDLLVKFSFKTLENKKMTDHGFDEPRVMEVAFHIAILLNKHGQTDFVSTFKESVKKFEELYQKRWFSDVPEEVKISSPSRDQLLNEILGLLSNRESYYRDDFPGIESQFPVQRFMSMVNRQDIKDFIKVIWDIEVKD